jgi:hypothetical protein
MMDIDDRRVTKVSFDGKRVKVLYEIPRVGSEDPDECALVCNDRPAPEFLVALEALRPHVAAICQLPPPYCEPMAIRGASYGYGGKDAVMGATITSLKKLTTANSPLVLNTPYLASEPMSETDEAPTLSASAVRALDELARQGLRYVNGEREQGDLFPKTQEMPATAAGRRVVQAIANLAPKPGSGIDSVTLSSGDKEVTLKQGDGERIRRGLSVSRGCGAKWKRTGP